jgi:hypothetical protein
MGVFRSSKKALRRQVLVEYSLGSKAANGYALVGGWYKRANRNRSLPMRSNERETMTPEPKAPDIPDLVRRLFDADGELLLRVASEAADALEAQAKRIEELLAHERVLRNDTYKAERQSTEDMMASDEWQRRAEAAEDRVTELDEALSLLLAASNQVAMERDRADARVAELEKALKTIQQWDALNPPGRYLLADLPWLRRHVDAALAADAGKEGK